METKLRTQKSAPKASPKNGAGPKYDASARPLWEIACELSAQIPEEELAKVPLDASVNLHHYLYGAPRVKE